MEVVHELIIFQSFNLGTLHASVAHQVRWPLINHLVICLLILFGSVCPDAPVDASLPELTQELLSFFTYLLSISVFGSQILGLIFGVLVGAEEYLEQLLREIKLA